MKKNKIKQTIIAGFITILGVALFIGGYIWTDTISRASTPEPSSKTKKIHLIKNVPTVQDMKKLVPTPKKKQIKEKIVAVNVKKDTIAPLIDVPEATVEQDAQINIYDGVSATDNHDGDLTTKVSAENTLDTSIIGDQTVHFSVTDQHGNTDHADRLYHIVAKNEPIAVTPAPVEDTAITPTPEAQATSAVSTATSEPVAAPAYAPMTLTMNGQTIPYQNGGQGSGQSIIDSNPGGVASTWGGSAVQSGDDGQNTHFIGHNPGIFSNVFSLGVGSQIVVTDANGTPTTYTVQTLLQLDDYGNEVGTGTSYWDFTVGTGGGERITLQSCINDDVNLFVIAYK